MVLLICIKYSILQYYLIEASGSFATTHLNMELALLIINCEVKHS